MRSSKRVAVVNRSTAETKSAEEGAVVGKWGREK
jgi:hypothetical protein